MLILISQELCGLLHAARLNGEKHRYSHFEVHSEQRVELHPCDPLIDCFQLSDQLELVLFHLCVISA